MAGQVISKVATADGKTHLISHSLYGTCTTTNSTAAKEIVINDPNITEAITLANGMMLTVKFTKYNSVANPTFTIYNNSGTAASPTKGTTTLVVTKTPMRYGTTTMGTTSATSWRDGAVVNFVYDGTNWVETTGIDDNTTYTVANYALGNGYATLTTTTPTQVAKAATLTSYSLSTGGRVSVYCQYANTTPAPTMNINTRGSKNIWINNAASSASNPVLWDAGDILELVYDGTQYQLVSKSATDAEILDIVNS